MGRFAGSSGRELRRIAESEGWALARVSGDHFVFKKPGIAWNVSIPDHRELREGLVRKLVADIGLSTDEFLRRAKK